MSGVAGPKGAVAVEQIRVPMRDGVQLAAVLHHLPSEPQPVILIRTPCAEPLAPTFPITPALAADFAAKLVDVHPDGRAMGVANSIVRARYRGGVDDPQPITPGEVYEYRIDIASSNFPCYDRNSGSGKPAGEATEADLRPANQRIFFGPDHPSAVRLPVIAPES